jgi:hypothetical protein
MSTGTTNIHTGADLHSKATTREYQQGHARVFGERAVPPARHQKRAGSTACIACGADLVAVPASDYCPGKP